jgi:hypothetical protein
VDLSLGLRHKTLISRHTRLRHFRRHNFRICINNPDKTTVFATQTLHLHRTTHLCDRTPSQDRNLSHIQHHRKSCHATLMCVRARDNCLLKHHALQSSLKPTDNRTELSSSHVTNAQRPHHRLLHLRSSPNVHLKPLAR